MRIPLRAVGLRFCGFVSLLALLSSPVHSQAPGSGSDTAQTTQAGAVPNRISPAADWSSRVRLRNHLPLWANAQNSTGAASADMTLNMVLARSPEQQAALEQLLVDQKNPASPEFHHWLTPTEFGQRFGLSQSDIQSITNWLVAQGLRIHYVSPSRTFIGFGGSAVAVGQAFGTEIRNYSVRGEARVSVSSDPVIPAPLAPVVKAIRGLYTIDDRPQHMMTQPQAAGPNLTLGNGAHYMVPSDFSKIYDAVVSASGYQQTIGIVGRSRTNFEDFNNFNSVTEGYFQLPTEVVPTSFGGVDPGPAYTTTPPKSVSLGEQSEATLDVTRAGSIAHNANLLLVVATNASGGIAADAQYLIQTSPVPAQVINISYGACEAQAGQSGVDFWDTLFQQAAAEGISVFVSSGDSGASGCEQAFTTPVASPVAISPNYICSSSYATCVGGTQFNDTATPSQYWGASNGNDLSSALQYIPEGAWNQPTDSQGNLQVVGTGGGVSAFIATPKWQKGPGVPAARTGRYTPDVSFSGSCHDPYFACMAAAGASCVVDSSGSFYFIGFCGTSASAPSMAGVAALLNEKMQFSQGSLNPQIYALSANQPSTFHDTTPSSSGVTSCDIHTPSMCNNSTPGPASLTGGQAGYALTSGYDMVTGVGSVDVANFLTNFASALPVPTVTVAPSSTSVTPADPLTITVTVDGGSGQPTATGIIRMSSADFNPPDTALVNGSVTYNIPAYTLGWSPDGETFTAQYVPDSGSSSVYGPAQASQEVNVTALTPTVNMNLSSTTVTTADDIVVNVSVAGPSGAPVPTGLLSVDAIAGTNYGVSGKLSGGSIKLTIPAGVLAPGDDYIEVTYAPDQAARPVYLSTGQTSGITVTQAPKTTPSVSSMLSASTITLADSLTVNIKVTPAAGSAAPTGTVSVTGNGRTLAATLSGGSAQIVAGAAWLPIGTDTLTIGYSGDNNTNAASITTSVVVNKVASTLVVSPGYPSITEDQSLSVAVTVNAPDGVFIPTGTVIVASGSYTSSPVPLVVGQAILAIPAGSLTAGTDTLTASYSGDGNYSTATGTATVTVNAVPPGLTVAGTNVAIGTAGATTGNTSTITLTPAGGFTGSVSLTASVTTSPAGAQNPPTLSFGSTTPVMITSTAAAHATLTVTTTPAATSAVVPPPTHRSWIPAGGTALGLLVLFGIPARRRKLRAWLGMLLLFAGVSIGMTACGGGSSGSSTPPAVTHPGTTAGTYVVTVTATSGAVTAKTTLQVIVD